MTARAADLGFNIVNEPIDELIGSSMQRAVDNITQLNLIEAFHRSGMSPEAYVEKIGSSWIQLVFPDLNVNTLVHLNVPEEVWSHAMKPKFRKHGTKKNLLVSKRHEFH